MFEFIAVNQRNASNEMDGRTEMKEITKGNNEVGKKTANKQSYRVIK